MLIEIPLRESLHETLKPRTSFEKLKQSSTKITSCSHVLPHDTSPCHLTTEKEILSGETSKNGPENPPLQISPGALRQMASHNTGTHPLPVTTIVPSMIIHHPNIAITPGFPGFGARCTLGGTRDVIS